MIKRDLSYDKVISYFKELVQLNLYLENFVAYSEKELTMKADAKRGLKGYTLALFQYTATLDGNKQHTLGKRTIGFAIIKPTSNDDFTAQYKTIAEAEQIGLSVISRINYDSKLPDHWLYNNFDKRSVRFNEITATESDNFYGMEFFFQVQSWESLNLDANDWEDIKQTCHND